MIIFFVLIIHASLKPRSDWQVSGASFLAPENLCKFHVYTTQVSLRQKLATENWQSECGLIAILPGEPGLATFPLDSSSSPCPSQTGEGTAVKEVEWRKVHSMRGN